MSEDPVELVKYAGPSMQTRMPPGDAVTILDYVDSDETARVIDRLLSARQIAFTLQRPRTWSGIPARIWVSISPADEMLATELLAAAAEAGLLVRGEPGEGTDHY